MADVNIQIKDGQDNVYPSIKHNVVTQKKELQFTNGVALVALSNSYDLVSAVVVDRPSTEGGTYAITNIYCRTDNYRLQNKETSLTAKLNALLTWVAK